MSRIDRVMNEGVLKRWNRRRAGDYNGTESVEMVWTRTENGSVPYG